MTTMVGIGDLATSANITQEYDYTRSEGKGAFASSACTKELETSSSEKSDEQKKEKLQKLKSFSDKRQIDEIFEELERICGLMAGFTNDKSYKELKVSYIANKYGEKTK